ncbi:mitochondrial outer membrane protein porin of 36 kDa-like isoform X2 [Rhodamnia argentea]|uniref:Mitochondrial outer membrane protein porin of 36 kDa-like isoform X2 n=1 Tax=Rhodamnia argentea TaxID=178133 RepID=A0A8B8P8S8_9MYRT|nr:mitochondrial outer membrane protein porin of 36 kDa-like isoform X2 [Rhodamnia argentea]
MSKCPGSYINIGKEARDLLYKGYGQQPPVHFHQQFIDINCDLSCDVTCRIKEIVPGLGTAFRLIAPYSGKVELQYLHDYAAITAGTGVIANASRGYDPMISFSGVVGSTQVFLGTDIVFNISARAFNRIDAGLSLRFPFLEASLTLNDKLDTLRASCYHTVNPLTQTAVAAELKHGFSTSYTSITMGTQQAISTSTLVKARVDTKGKLGALIQQKCLQKLYLSIAGELEFRRNSRNSLDWIPKIGMTFSMRP